MARTQKAPDLDLNRPTPDETMEPKHTAEDAADVPVSVDDTSVLLNNLSMGTLLLDAEESSQQPDNVPLPEMEADGGLPPDDEQSSCFAEQSQEDPVEDTESPIKHRNLLLEASLNRNPQKPSEPPDGKRRMPFRWERAL